MILIVNQIKIFRIRDLLIYSRTIQELQAALDLADEERNDPSKWVSSIEFHQRLEEKYPWLR